MSWYLRSVHFDPESNLPTGPPEWPFPGGRLKQPAALVAAVDVLQAEMRHLRLR